VGGGGARLEPQAHGNRVEPGLDVGGETLGRTLEIDDGTEERIDARITGNGGVTFDDALRGALEPALLGEVAEGAVTKPVFAAASHGNTQGKESNGHDRITPVQSLHERSP